MHMMQELREMVIRGPSEHPGANAVEDENGRLVNLTHMSLQVWQASLISAHTSSLNRLAAAAVSEAACCGDMRRLYCR